MAPPPGPAGQDTLSSYGYINADVVRLRKEASTDSATLKNMNRNAFALVLGSVQQPDGTWYRINQGGTEGYVMGKFLNILPLNQLTQYLQSTEYQNANNVAAPAQGTKPSLTSVEDFNTGVWLNPALAQASYEPFNPLASATPAVETIQSPTPGPEDESGFQVEASPSADPFATFEPLSTEAPRKEGGSFPFGWLAVGIIGVLGGGGYYAYRMYQENQRRAAQRAAQRRQQAQQPPQVRPGQPGQPPFARPAGAQPPQPGPQRPGMPPIAGQPSPYQPPQQGALPTGPRSPARRRGSLRSREAPPRTGRCSRTRRPCSRPSRRAPPPTARRSPARRPCSRPSREAPPRTGRCSRARRPVSLRSRRAPPPTARRSSPGRRQPNRPSRALRRPGRISSGAGAATGGTACNGLKSLRPRPPLPPPGGGRGPLL